MWSSNTGGGGNKDDRAPAIFNEGERVLAYYGPCLYEAKFGVGARSMSVFWMPLLQEGTNMRLPRMQLVKLPRSPNVDDILKKYLDYRTKKDGMVSNHLCELKLILSRVAESVVAEILKALRCYFDKALLAILLYKECQQNHEAVGDKVFSSTIYGAEHLLRLYVKLPELLACVNMEEEALAKLQQKLLDFSKYAEKIRAHSSFLRTMEDPKAWMKMKIDFQECKTEKQKVLLPPF